MYGCFINYLFLKEALESIPKEIYNDMDIDDTSIFCNSNFINISRFMYIYNPFCKDKYNLHERFLEKSDAFIIDCAVNLHQKNDYKRLIYLYGMIASTTLRDYLIQRISRIKRENDSIEYIYNILDLYYSTKDNKDIVKYPLFYYFKGTYTYPDYIEDLIHYPLVKEYHFMGSKGYYTKCYKRFKHFTKYSCHGTWRIPLYKLYDAIFSKHKPKKQYLPYGNKKIKNKTESYGIYHDAIDAIWTDALNDASAKIYALNQYLFNSEDKELKRKFNIPENKKI